jgi:hypothetical protein
MGGREGRHGKREGIGRSEIILVEPKRKHRQSSLKEEGVRISTPLLLLLHALGRRYMALLFYQRPSGSCCVSRENTCISFVKYSGFITSIPKDMHLIVD